MKIEEYTLVDAICSAQDNLPPKYAISIVLAKDGWCVNLLKNNITVASRHYLNQGAEITGTVVKFINKARMQAGLPK